jgi:uncharacterized protein Veg
MIRETYLRHKPHNMMYKFIIASSNEEMQEEMYFYQDILTLEQQHNFFETISN